MITSKSSLLTLAQHVCQKIIWRTRKGHLCMLHPRPSRIIRPTENLQTCGPSVFLHTPCSPASFLSAKTLEMQASTAISSQETSTENRSTTSLQKQLTLSRVSCTSVQTKDLPLRRRWITFGYKMLIKYRTKIYRKTKSLDDWKTSVTFRQGCE